MSENTNQNNNATVNNENVNPNANAEHIGSQGQPTPVPKPTFAERHPKFVGLVERVPGALLRGLKSVAGGALAIVGGIVASELLLNWLDKPKSYGTMPLGEDMKLTDNTMNAKFVDSEVVTPEPAVDHVESATPFDV